MKVLILEKKICVCLCCETIQSDQVMFETRCVIAGDLCFTCVTFFTNFFSCILRLNKNTSLYPFLLCFITRVICYDQLALLDLTFNDLPFILQALMQDSKNHIRYKNTIDALSQLGRQHGFTEYYRGLSAILIRNGPANVIFFTARERLSVPDPSYARQFATGACIGALVI